ncbi:hypothetical protein C1H46_017539 [Malus baccata]|uniref:Apyrase n=1 Tax=Malus baccata TaxID=106549 RepID=A0A540MDH9_MALBA|nr:hypothetical protein C1H46_017539 [Malus baccata]
MGEIGELGGKAQVRTQRYGDRKADGWILPLKKKTQLNHFFQAFKTSVMIIVIMLLFFGAYFGFNSMKGRSASASKGSYFTVVVDCGSTGTRVNVYEWLVMGVSGKELPTLLYSYPDNSTKGMVSKSCKYHCLQTEPGLDKFVGNLSGVRASLEPLITLAEHKVPSERRRETPIFVLATAGLRRLAVEDSRQVLDDIESVLKECSFLYKKSWIRVLSGKEEAYYGWVALNYKIRSFQNPSRSPTLGLLDLGGSSLQVVVQTDGEREDANLLRSKFGFVEHEILAYSLSEFGLNEAFDRTVAMLSQRRESAAGVLEIRHPCLRTDVVQNYTCYGCVRQNGADRKNVIGQLQETKFPSVHLVGAPDWEQCRTLARAAAINSSTSDAEQGTRSCSDNGSEMVNLTAVAHPTARFHALSGFFAVYDKLNLSGRATLPKIWEKGQQLCSKSWSDQTGNSQNGYFAWQYCFRVPYTASLVEDALCLGDKEIVFGPPDVIYGRVPYTASLVEDALCLGDKEIVFGPPDVTWTLGAALVEGEYLWSSTSRSRTSILTLNMEVASSPIFVLVLLLFLLVVVYCSQVKLPMIGKQGAARASLPVREQKMMD